LRLLPLCRQPVAGGLRDSGATGVITDFIVIADFVVIADVPTCPFPMGGCCAPLSRGIVA